MIALILAIIATVISTLLLAYTIFLAYKIYSFEDFVILQLSHLIDQLNTINAKEYAVDSAQQKNIEELKHAVHARK